MMDFIETFNLTGLLIGISTFLIIGIFHPIVIKSEYHFGVRCWWVFLVIGIMAGTSALCVRQVLGSSLLGVLAFSSLWSILEVFEQRERVRKGWFPVKSKKDANYTKNENKVMNDTIRLLNEACRNTLVEHLEMVFIGVGEEWLEARMPISRKTCRLDGKLHGGANMALAETVGGALSFISVPQEQQFNVFGIEVNGNHIKQAEGAYVIARASFLHKGKRSHVVNVEIRDESGKLVTINRVTNMII